MLPQRATHFHPKQLLGNIIITKLPALLLQQTRSKQHNRYLNAFMCCILTLHNLSLVLDGWELTPPC